MENIFGERLKELRLEKGASLKEVGDAVGVTLNTISNYERGVREPDFEILRALCGFFGVSADYLIGLSDY